MTSRGREQDETLADRLERELEAALNGQHSGQTEESDELSALLGVGIELRGLPRADFRAQLARSLRPPIAPRDLREEARTLLEREPRLLGSMDRVSILLFKSRGTPPWERHPDGDEMLLVLDGGGRVTVLTEDGPVESELRPGRIFVCPKGLWHRVQAEPEITALYLTPLAGGEHSFAEDPRTGA